MVGATEPDGGALHAVNGNDYMSLLLMQKMDYRFKSGLIIKIINKGQSNDCPLSMVGATGPDGGAAHAVNGNNYMSLSLTRKMDYCWFKSVFTIKRINNGHP